MQTVPRTIWLDKSGKQLVQWPVEEIERRRGKQVNIRDKELGSGSIVEVSGITASQVNSFQCIFLYISPIYSSVIA